MENLNIEEIRKLREALDLKERKRVRERDKVLGFVIGMIIPIGLILYITLNISCRSDSQRVFTLITVCPPGRPTLLPICSVTATNKGCAMENLEKVVARCHSCQKLLTSYGFVYL